MAQTNFRAEDMLSNSSKSAKAVKTPEPTPEPDTEEKTEVTQDTPKRAGTKGSGGRKKAQTSDGPETHEYTVERDGETVIEAEGVEHNG